ncbi:MAG: hypothetical protein AAFW81_04590 [Pseudomonadota bacterium]
MRFINDQLHGVIDYLAALALIIAPFVLGFTGLAQLLSVAAGVALIIYSLLTSYSLSARKAIPFNIHLMIDFLAGAAFVAAPFVLGFEGLVKTYFLVMGGAVILVVLLTDPNTATAEA